MKLSAAHILATALVIAFLAPTVSLAQTAKGLVGTWTLVSAVTEKDGVKSDIFGADAKGILIFDAGGRYALIFTAAGLPKFASANRATGTPEENKAVVLGSLAHFGTYTVDEADKSFVFRVANSTYPNWSSTEQKRVFEIVGDQLTYTDPAPSAGGRGTLIWQRTK